MTISHAGSGKQELFTLRAILRYTTPVGSRYQWYKAWLGCYK
jgi:hypothetical protein